MKVFEQAIEDADLIRNLHDEDEITSAIKDMKNAIAKIKENLNRDNREIFNITSNVKKFTEEDLVEWLLENKISMIKPRRLRLVDYINKIMGV